MSVQSNWTWFLLALAPAVASQIVRMGQTDPLAWLAWDYAGRLGTLLVLAVIPAARLIAFAREARTVRWPELAIWGACLLAFELVIGRSITSIIDAAMPGTRLTTPSNPRDWLFAVDLTFGIALVAYQEEVVFRRCAHAVLSKTLSGRTTMVIASALLFGIYHWSRGLGTITSAVVFGIVAMIFYLRAGVLWPLVLVHYLTDVMW